MNKKVKSIFDLSLFQQLSVIIITFAVIFVFFFTVYLRGNIDDFVTNQMMSILQSSQDNVVNSIENGEKGYSTLSYDSGVVHFVFKDGAINSLYPKNFFYSDDLIKQVHYFAFLHDDSWAEGIFTADKMMYYYRSNIINDDMRIVSIISEEYAKTIETSLLNSVSNNSAIVFSIMFLSLIVWISGIITPLQLIRNYIDKIKAGKDAKLNVNRSDEIGEVADALIAMNKELKAQEELKNEMIHNISHDLKTPIATIKSYAQSIRDGIYPYDTLEGSVDVIIANAERLEKKVYSLLYLNRLDYIFDQEKDNNKTTEMVPLIEDVILSMKMIRPEVNVINNLQECSFKGDGESWRVVISNLLDNALRYANNQIVITLAPYSFAISNDGPMMDGDRMAKLFKPFEKGDKGKFGLGLSICYKVCNAYGYNISAENIEYGVIFKIDAKDKPAAKKGLMNFSISDISNLSIIKSKNEKKKDEK